MAKINISVIFLVCGAMTMAMPAVLDERKGQEIVSPKLEFVAQADEKLFFAETTPKRTWADAKDYCKTMGMNLASITSVEQYTALKDARNETTFFGGYWTSGRDAHKSRQISWDRDNEEPGSYLPFSLFFTSFLSCIFYDTTGSIILSQCGNQMGTMCEFDIPAN